jgi:ribosome maturation protein SDO1
MQISQKEREIFTGNKFKEVANVIAEKIVHPVTNRPFPVEVIEEAMRTIRYNPKMNEDTKKQAISCIRALMTKYKIIRARM